MCWGECAALSLVQDQQQYAAVQDWRSCITCGPSMLRCGLGKEAGQRHVTSIMHAPLTSVLQRIVGVCVVRCTSAHCAWHHVEPQIRLAQLAGRCTGAGGLRPLESMVIGKEELLVAMRERKRRLLQQELATALKEVDGLRMRSDIQHKVLPLNFPVGSPYMASRLQGYGSCITEHRSTPYSQHWLSDPQRCVINGSRSFRQFSSSSSKQTTRCSEMTTRFCVWHSKCPRMQKNTSADTCFATWRRGRCRFGTASSARPLLWWWRQYWRVRMLSEPHASSDGSSECLQVAESTLPSHHSCTWALCTSKFEPEAMKLPAAW